MSEENSKQRAILIVDDAPTNLDVLVDYFADSGFEISVATSGESANQTLVFSGI